MSFEIEQRFRSLEQLIVAASSKGVDEQIASYLCKLGSVLICGNLERCVEIIITSRLASRSPPQITVFLKSYFKRGTNYDCDQISQLLYKFDVDWGRAFEAFVKNNSGVKESISSCYAIRNSVAHGGGQSLGYRILKQYFDDSLTIISELQVIVR